MSARPPEEIIRRCWRNGLGIGQTRLAVDRWCGSKPDPNEVRRVFARLASEFAGGHP